MTTGESKGRFVLLNELILIDSHNESNRFESRIGMLYRRSCVEMWVFFDACGVAASRGFGGRSLVVVSCTLCAWPPHC